MKPNRNESIKNKNVNQYVSDLENYVVKNNDNYHAKIDLLKILLKIGSYEKFENLYHELRIDKPSFLVYAEFAKYLIFIKKDYARAKRVLSRATEFNEEAPSWCYFFQDKEFNYYEKIAEGVIYTAIPKNASTSLKTFVLKEWHKKPGLNPHSVFGNPFFKTERIDKSQEEKSLKIVVVREPVKRIVSYYNKNILDENSLAYEYGLHDTDKSELFGLRLKPSFDFFIENFERYCICFNDVFHHTLPQAAYIADIRSYDIVVDVSEVDEAVNKVAEYLNIPFSGKAPHEMTVAKDKKVASSHSQNINWDKLKSMYRVDYEMLARYQSNKASKIDLYNDHFSKKNFVETGNE